MIDGRKYETFVEMQQNNGMNFTKVSTYFLTVFSMAWCGMTFT
jgi:hypothetical protein